MLMINVLLTDTALKDSSGVIPKDSSLQNKSHVEVYAEGEEGRG